MIRTIIIDDEKNAREAVRAIVEGSFDDIDIIGEAASVMEAVKLINKEKPDLLFLDIDLNDGTGFDILNGINYKELKVIFITAYQEHAIRAIKFSAFDFILKPVKVSEIVQAVNNLKSELAEDNYEQKYEAFFSNYNNRDNNKKLVLRTAEKIHVVYTNQIVSCQSDNSYTTFHLADKSKILVSKSIKMYDEILSPCGFMRIHRSHLINLEHINYYEKQDGGTIVMNNNNNIPVAHQKKADLLKYLDSL